VLCYFTPLVESYYFVGLLFFGVCGVLLAFVKAVASMKVQIYEIPHGSDETSSDCATVTKRSVGRSTDSCCLRQLVLAGG